MHVLSEPSADGGHGMVMDLQTRHNTTIYGQNSSATTSMDSAAATTMLMPDSSMSSMATCCILFLVVGAATVMLALLVATTAQAAVGTLPPFSGVLERSPRGPPGRRPPRISLCVLRV